MTTYYVTQWALTEGILTIDSESVQDFKLTQHQAMSWIFGTYSCYIPASGWTATLEEAQERVRSLAEAKVRSMEKSRKKMEDLMLHGADVNPFLEE